MSILHTFPVELLVELMKHMQRKDLVRFRQTCRKHAQIGEKLLFETVHLMIRPKSFENLQFIANHPVLSKHVKTLYYEPFVPIEPVDQKDWERYIPHPNDRRSFDELEEVPKSRPASERNSNDRVGRYRRREKARSHLNLTGENCYTEAQRRKAWTAFMSILNENAKLYHAFADLRVMMKTFTQLPNLKNVKVGTFGKDEFKSAHAITAAYRETMVLLSFQESEKPRNQDFCVRGLENCLWSADHANLKLESLEVESLGWDAFDPHETYLIEHSDDCKSEVGLPIFLSTFQWLKIIKLSFLPGFAQDGEASILRHDQLGHALQAATRLESVHLEFSNSRRHLTLTQAIQHVPFDRLAKQTSWPRLQHLCLVGADTNEEFFVNFIKRHPRLQSLVLKDTRMKTGKWATTLEKLKANLTALKKINVEGRFVVEDSVENEPPFSYSHGCFACSNGI